MPGIVESDARAAAPRLTDEAELRRLALATIGLRDARAALRERRGWSVRDRCPTPSASSSATSPRNSQNATFARCCPSTPSGRRRCKTSAAAGLPLRLGQRRPARAARDRHVRLAQRLERGLQAARACGREVAKHGMHVVSGYARGVDTVTHLAALRRAPGPSSCWPRASCASRSSRSSATPASPVENALVLSQFPRDAALTRWRGDDPQRHYLRTRSRARRDRSRSEAAPSTPAAKLLKIRRSVRALQFGEDAPAGNRALFDEGAHRLCTTGELAAELKRIRTSLNTRA